VKWLARIARFDRRAPRSDVGSSLSSPVSAVNSPHANKLQKYWHLPQQLLRLQIFSALHVLDPHPLQPRLEFADKALRRVATDRADVVSCRQKRRWNRLAGTKLSKQSNPVRTWCLARSTPRHTIHLLDSCGSHMQRVLAGFGRVKRAVGRQAVLALVVGFQVFPGGIRLEFEGEIERRGRSKRT